MSDISWNNLDKLESFKKLQSLKGSVSVAKELSSADGAKRVAEYSIPMGGGLTYNYAAKQVNPQVLSVLEELAKEVDFFSIGTNDLSQYTLAIDRQNAKVSEFFDAYHPAIFRLIEMTIASAHKHGIKAGICGELGADTRLTEQFLDMGVDELSVAPSQVLSVKEAIISAK